jgi:hypothetical protein
VKPLLFALSSFGDEKKLNEDNVYLICRGTKNKQNLIAENFNMAHKEITHIGLGLIENNSLNIYNISVDKKVNNSSLVVETWEDFKNLPDIFYIGAWAIPSHKNDIAKLKSILRKYTEMEIAFDYDFNLEDNNNFYCSEFVAKVLNELDRFIFTTFKKEAISILKRIINKDEFEYFPVDFFLQNPDIIPVYEERFDPK